MDHQFKNKWEKVLHRVHKKKIPYRYYVNEYSAVIVMHEQ